MADEILWQARIHPRVIASSLADEQLRALWQTTRFVCRMALKHVGADFSDPPKGWLFHERWRRGGSCPRDGEKLHDATIGGRTTVWCAKCQKPHAKSAKGKK